MKRRIRKKSISVESHLVPERKTILDFLAAANKPRNLNKIAEALAVQSPQARQALERRLLAMQRDGQVIKNRRDGYGLAQKMDLLRGRVIGHPDGFGFLRLDEGGDDLFLSPREMRSLMHGDVILAHVRGADRRGRRGGCLRAVADGEPQGEARASPGQILGRHPSAVRLDDADGQAEAEARPFARDLRREERVEDPPQVVRGNTGPVVFDLNHDVVALTQRAHGEDPAARVRLHGVRRVGEEVQQYLL